MAELATELERDTMLWPEAIADSLVGEGGRDLVGDFAADFPERLAAKT